MPVCSNCGSEEFVWTESLRTGSIGRGSLSLRSGGELPLGARICRGCGRADLFLKDLTVVRDPQKWAKGEFVPLAPAASPASPISPPPRPTAGPLVPSELPAPAPLPLPTAQAAVPEPPVTEPKRVPRRRAAPRSKAAAPALSHD